MSTDETPLRPDFLRVFGLWFNVDLIDLGNADEVRKAAGTVAANLLREGATADEVAEAFSGALARWTPAVAMEFVQATDVDWLADAAAEDQLRSILSEIVTAARLVEQRAASNV